MSWLSKVRRVPVANVRRAHDDFDVVLCTQSMEIDEFLERCPQWILVPRIQIVGREITRQRVPCQVRGICSMCTPAASLPFKGHSSVPNPGMLPIDSQN